MTPAEDRPGLFYLACVLVALVIVFILGRRLLGVGGRRPPPRLSET